MRIPPKPGRPLESHRSQFFDEPLSGEAITKLLDHLVQGRQPDQTRTLSFLPMGGAYNRVPVGATAFAHRDHRFLVEHISAVPPTASRAKQVAATEWSARSRRILAAEASGGVYPNFPDPDLTDWASAYWGANHTRLQQVKQRFDPNNLFWGPTGSARRPNTGVTHMTEPRSSEPIANEPATLRHAAEHGRQPAALPWADFLDHLARADGIWVVTLDRTGSPCPRPVFAVVADGAVHTSSSPAALKARNLGHDARCALGAHTDEFDLVIEGTGRRVTEPDRLERVAAVYSERYGWPVTVVDDAMDAPFGAPTAGPPPYAVFRIEPIRAYVIGITEETNYLSTRYRF